MISFVVIVTRVSILLFLVHCLKLVKEVFFYPIALAVFSVGVVESPAKGDKFVVIRVVELRELAHAVTIDVLTVRDAIIFVFVALALVLRLFIVVLVVVASLVEERGVGVIENVLRVGANLPKCVNKPFRRLVNFGVCVIKVRLPLHI